jgi:hypothetical protein
MSTELAIASDAAHALAFLMRYAPSNMAIPQVASLVQVVAEYVESASNKALDTA